MGWFGAAVGPHHRKTSPCVSSEAAPVGYFRSLLDGLQASEFETYQIFQRDDIAFKLIDLQNIKTSRVGLVPEMGIMSPAYIRLIPDRKSVKPNYAYWFFTDLYNRQVFNQLGGGVRQTLGPEELLVLPFPYPPLEEQGWISDFLDRETAKIDALVAEQEQLITLLKEKRQAVISHAVTKGLDPSATYKNSGIEWIAEVPAHWEISKLGKVSFMQEGPGLRTWQFVSDGVRVICVTNITENGIDFSRLEKFISQEEYEKAYRHFTVDNGDILLSSSGNSWGKVAIYDNSEAVILNTSTIRLNENKVGNVCGEFLAFLLQSICVREQLSIAMTGSCQPNFGPTHLKVVFVAIPPIDEQKSLIKHLKCELESLDVLTKEAARGIELLQERRAALISAAVTGQIDVRGLASKGQPHEPHLHGQNPA